jgi:hypothetical protein
MHTAGESFHIINPYDLSSFTAMKREACSSHLIVFAMPECYICTVSREGCEIYKRKFFYKNEKGDVSQFFQQRVHSVSNADSRYKFCYTTAAKLNKKYSVPRTLKTTQIIELYFQTFRRYRRNLYAWSMLCVKRFYFF